MAQPRATVDAQVDALTELLMRNHVACVSDDPRERAALLGAARRQCAELSRIYVTGLAQVHATVRAATARQYELKGEAENLASFQIPVMAAHTRRARLDEQLRRQLHCALRSYRHEAARCGAEIEACLARPEVAAMRRRAERLQQPVFGCPHQREQQRCAEDDARIRALPAMRRVVGTGQPRAYFRCTPDGLTVLTTIHGFFGIKSLHRPCRTAAGAPFGVPCVAWRAVLLSPSPRARERLGGRHVLVPRPARGRAHADGHRGRRPARRHARALRGQPPHRGARCRRLPSAAGRGRAGAAAGDAARPVAAPGRRPLQVRGARAAPAVRRAHRARRRRPARHGARRGAVAARGRRAAAAPALAAARRRADGPRGNRAPRRGRGARPHGGRDRRRGRRAPAALRATEPGYDGVAVLEVDAHLALRTMVECERAGLMVDYAEFWGGPRGQVCRRAARVPRFGEERGAAVSEAALRAFAARWYRDAPADGSRHATWAERAVAAWFDILHEYGVDPDDPVAVQKEGDALVRTLQCLGEPLRWFTHRIAATMHPELALPPLQRAETAPGSMLREQQLRLVTAAVYEEWHDDAETRAQCRLMLRVFFEQIGRFPWIGPPRPLAAAPRPRSRARPGVELWESPRGRKRRRA